MPYVLTLPSEWKSRGWQAKIAEKEHVEPPHVTLLRKGRRYRLGLRDARFLDGEPDPRDVPVDLLEIVLDAFPALCRAWDAKYPWNPVPATESEDDD